MFYPLRFYSFTIYRRAAAAEHFFPERGIYAASPREVVRCWPNPEAPGGRELKRRERRAPERGIYPASPSAQTKRSNLSWG